MFNKLIFGHELSKDETLDCFYNDTFKIESDWLIKRREDIIGKDKLENNRMLINNPNREVNLRGSTIL